MKRENRSGTLLVAGGVEVRRQEGEPALAHVERALKALRVVEALERFEAEQAEKARRPT